MARTLRDRLFGKYAVEATVTVAEQVNPAMRRIRLETDQPVAFPYAPGRDTAHLHDLGPRPRPDGNRTARPSVCGRRHRPDVGAGGTARGPGDLLVAAGRLLHP
ncbi:hypothetical protein [Nonomuraea sp. AD125B]|uniref:hypothetical protein n=1 Tax=Nonomuraea sp. AD125B TaxID=3242897 RepID=UPI003526CF00